LPSDGTNVLLGETDCGGRSTLTIQKVLSQLRRERRVLEHAIAALEALQKRSPKRTRVSGEKSSAGKKAVRRGKGNASNAGRGQESNVLTFPALRRSGS